MSELHDRQHEEYLDLVPDIAGIVFVCILRTFKLWISLGLVWFILVTAVLIVRPRIYCWVLFIGNWLLERRCLWLFAKQIIRDLASSCIAIEEFILFIHVENLLDKIWKLRTVHCFYRRGPVEYVGGSWLFFFFFFLMSWKGSHQFFVLSFSKVVLLCLTMLFLNNLVWILNNFWPKWVMKLCILCSLNTKFS